MSSPARRLLGRGSAYTAATLFQLSAAAVVLPLITRILDPDQYGLVALALGFQVVLAALVGAGLPAAITRMHFEPPERDGSVPVSVRLIVNTVGIAGAATLLIAASTPLWAPYLGPSVEQVVLLGVLLALPTAVLASVQAVLRAQEAARYFIAVALLGSLGAQLLGLAALQIEGPSPSRYLVGYAAGIVVAAAVGAGLAGVRLTRPAASTEFRDALSIGLPMVPHGLAVFVLALGDRVLIQILDGSSAVGRYQVAYAFGALTLAFLAAVQNAWLPVTFSVGLHERWSALSETTVLVARLAAYAAGTVALVSPLGLAILAPSAYEPRDLVPVAGIVAAAALPWAIYLPMVQVLLWHKRTRPLMWITPLAALVNLVLVAWLVPWVGLEGAALATLIAFGVQLVLTYRATSTLQVIRWEHRQIVVSTCVGATLVAIGCVLPPSTGADLLRTALTVGVIGAAAALIREAVANP